MVCREVKRSDAIAGESQCGLGRLLAVKDDRRGALPLAGVRLSARVADRVAEVSMVQTFRNPLAESLEAVYIFPLPGGAAVSAFEMKVGDRTLKGLCKERGQARHDYQSALKQGKRAALLEQERDDVFTCQVGNLPPGEEVTVKVIYSERLPFFEDGTTEVRLPLVVAPRYIPGRPPPRDPVGDGVEWDTDQVPDASRITPPRLAAGFDPKVALSIEVELSGAVADLACSQHAVALSNGRIALARQDELLNRDFVLRWRLAQEKLATSLLAHRDGTAMLSILPPRRDGFLGVARDVVFVLDRSGSMAGVKMTSAARACSILLATLGPRDRFAIVAFDDQAEWFNGRKFAVADEAGLAAGDRFLRTVDSRGGTELAPALQETLDLIDRRAEQDGRVPVVVVLTDGQVGNEAECFKRIQKEGGDARFFTVGIDTAVNEAFLKRVAALGGGTCTCVVPGEALEGALQSVGREIGTPLVVDLKIEGAEDAAPARLPDLFAGRAATVFLRPKGNKVTVRGKFADGKPFEEKVQVKEIDLPAVAHLWARTRVADLEDRYRLEPQNQQAIAKEIVDLSVRHMVLTRFTAFVVVDEKEIVNAGGDPRKIVQPVEMPDRWEMCKEEATAMYSLAGAPSHITARCRVPAPCPPPAKSKKKGGLLGMFSGSKADDGAVAETEEKVTKAQEKARREAVESLRKALEAARAVLDAGRVPSADPIEKARKALLKELAGSAVGALQRLLRTSLVELVAALRAPGTPAAVRPILDRCLAGLSESTREPKFWEATV
jgi:Ca-activated chloride channel family protein